MTRFPSSSSTLKIPLGKEKSRQGLVQGTKSWGNTLSSLVRTTDIITGEIVNLTDFETIRKRGEYLKVQGNRKRMTVEDFNKKIEIGSWKLLTLITDQATVKEAVEYLSDGIANLFDLEMTFESQRNFLIYAVVKSERKLIEKLIELKPSLVNKQDVYGRAAIHYAVLMRKVKLIPLLMENKADLNIKDITGQSPLHLAAQKFNREIYLLLKFKGADSYEVDNFGLRPLDYVEDQLEYQEIESLENGSPRKHYAMRRTTTVLTQQSDSFEGENGSICTIPPKSVFVNPGKYAFNLRRKYFSKIGLIQKCNTVSLPDAYLERYEKSMVELNCDQEEEKEEEEFIFKDPKSTAGYQKQASADNFSPVSEPCSAIKKKKFEKNRQSTSCMSHNAAERLCKVTVKDIQVLGMIGKGNFGKIYAVKIKRNETMFAMKAYDKKEFLMTNLARFLFAEKRIMANFEHPFIVKMHYAFQNNDRLFVLMDYCEKGDLGNLVTRLTDLQLKILACELVLAIKALHDKGIIHRDIKPNNVFVSPDGHIKVGDFGLAKEQVSRGSLHYTFCGSIAYLPPEIINRSGHNKCLDWYLLGELLYEMVVGSPPYYGESKDELYDNIRNKSLDMRKLPISDSLKDLVAGLLDRDITTRLGSKFDAVDIMSHRYFVGVDWQRVYDKKYELFDPSALQSYRVTKSLTDDAFKESHDDSLHLPHWSFVR